MICRFLKVLGNIYLSVLVSSSDDSRTFSFSFEFNILKHYHSYPENKLLR